MDVGCADDADLSHHFLQQNGYVIYAVDPTKSHRSTLEELARSNERFTYLPLALGAENTSLSFFHNTKFQSGSLFGKHINNSGKVEKYQVECVDEDANRSNGPF